MNKLKKQVSPEGREHILNEIGELLGRRDDVLFAYVYGSFARGEPFSDIDVGVYLSDRASGFDDLMFEAFLERKLGFPVDVRVINEAPLSFAFRVISEGSVVCSKDEAKRAAFESRIRLSYFDFKPFRDRYYREAILGKR